MSQHSAIIHWQRHQAAFTDNKYSRVHTWRFDGGIEVLASASPHVVPTPYADPTCVDPEEAFVAALSSCHMLWLLAIAAKQGFVVEQYTDHPTGVMGKDLHGAIALTHVYLRPQVEFAGTQQPTTDQLAALHQAAHHQCFLANSVKTQIVIEAASPPHPSD